MQTLGQREKRYTKIVFPLIPDILIYPVRKLRIYTGSSEIESINCLMRNGQNPPLSNGELIIDRQLNLWYYPNQGITK